MAEWVYEARTRAGEVQTGIIEADSKEAVHSSAWRLALASMQRSWSSSLASLQP
jgi:type II secretory pathway component PulF